MQRTNFTVSNDVRLTLFNQHPHLRIFRKPHYQTVRTQHDLFLRKDRLPRGQNKEYVPNLRCHFESSQVDGTLLPETSVQSAKRVDGRPNPRQNFPTD